MNGFGIQSKNINDIIKKIEEQIVYINKNFNEDYTVLSNKLQQCTNELNSLKEEIAGLNDYTKEYEWAEQQIQHLNADIEDIKSRLNTINYIKTESAVSGVNYYPIYAHSAIKDDKGNIITATYATKFDLNKKEDKLNYTYTSGKITEINGTALSAGTNYSAGANIQLVNKGPYFEISSKNWKPDIESAISGKADKTEIPTKVSQLENDKGYLTAHQDISNLATKEEVNKKLDTSSFNDTIENYYTKEKVVDILSHSGNYLSANALVDLSGNWNEVSAKLDKTEFNNTIKDYYTKNETSSKDQIDAALNKKQDNLTTEQISSISSVSSISSDLKNNYYTKTETSSTEELTNKFNTKQDNLSTEQLSSISSVSSISSDLKNNYYTSVQVDEKLANFGGFEVVDGAGEDQHPNVDTPSTKIIYLVKAESTKSDNYKEWIYSKDNTWELIGDTTIDLTNYYTKTDTSSKLELENEFKLKQDNLSSEQLSAISSVSSISCDLKNNYYTTAQSNENYLSINALDNVSGNWNEVSAKFDSSSITAYATIEYVNQNTLLTSYSADSISDTNLTALPNNSAVIDYVSEQISETIDIAPSITVDTPITNIPNVGAITSYGYSKTQLDSILETDYYKKTDTSGAQQISDALDEKQNNLTNEQISAISSVSSILNDYPNKMYTSSFNEAIENYYTKTEVDNKISGINVEYDSTTETVTLSLEV